MNLVYKALAMLALFGSIEGSAQKIGTLRGSVRDAETGEVLPGAGLTIVGTYLSAVTDANGAFVLANVPVVYLGERMTRLVPMRVVHIVSALVFAVLGVLALMPI